MKEKPYKVSLRQIHVQEIVLDAVSKADALGKAIDHEDGNGTEYFEEMDDAHEVEEL